MSVIPYQGRGAGLHPWQPQGLCPSCKKWEARTDEVKVRIFWAWKRKALGRGPGELYNFPDTKASSLQDSSI
ncbi:hypothetical protein AV530_014840 [Patagioenas fasciata monilis]|uniref:Uncharacterized protein n=1 Tax=Patagioenas fasciata monilis TaxID=372326 RepID=A0A1V4L088_PATFA|nr:hypothetical protein AV530_014840 [Patagioenas fasciata monilis]